jgi:MFS family permease
MQYRNSVLLLALLSNFSLLSSRLVLSPLVPDVIDPFSVSKSAVGMALTGLWAAYAVLQFPSGILSYRYGERPIILAALLLTGLGTLLLALAPSFLLLALFAVFVGAGAGLYYSVAMVLINRLFEEKSGFAMSVHGISVPLAGLVIPVVETVFVLAALVLPVMGRIADAVNNRVVLAFSLASMAAAFGLFVTGPHRLGLFVAGGLLGVGSGWEGALYSRLMDHLSVSKTGPLFGLLRTIILLVSSLGSTVTAFLVDVSGWPLAFGCLSGLLLLGFVSVIVSSARHGAVTTVT